MMISSASATGGIIEHRVVPFAAGNERFAVSKPFTVERDKRLIVYVQLSDVAYACEIARASRAVRDSARGQALM